MGEPAAHSGRRGSSLWPLMLAAALAVAALVGAAALLAPHRSPAGEPHAAARPTSAGVILSASPTPSSPSPTATASHRPTPTPTPTPTGPVVATASSQQAADLGPANVLDGNPTTRWSSAFRDRQWLAVDLGRTVRVRDVALNWENAYAQTFRLQVSDDGKLWRSVTRELAGNAGIQHVGVDVSTRWLRILGLTRATQYGFSLWSVDISAKLGPRAVRQRPCSPDDIARGMPTSASSEENADSTPARAATDGDAGSRWSSSAADGEWVQVDLTRLRSLCTVTLVWERAYATEFRLQGSVDGVAFTDITGPTQGQEGPQTVNVSGDWRFVRMAGTRRATQFGYSLFDFAVTARG